MLFICIVMYRKCFAFQEHALPFYLNDFSKFIFNITVKKKISNKNLIYFSIIYFVFLFLFIIYFILFYFLEK